jgi:hypothetical protein
MTLINWIYNATCVTTCDSADRKESIYLGAATLQGKKNPPFNPTMRLQLMFCNLGF